MPQNSTNGNDKKITEPTITEICPLYPQKIQKESGTEKGFSVVTRSLQAVTKIEPTSVPTISSPSFFFIL